MIHCVDPNNFHSAVMDRSCTLEVLVISFSWITPVLPGKGRYVSFRKKWPLACSYRIIINNHSYPVSFV